MKFGMVLVLLHRKLWLFFLKKKSMWVSFLSRRVRNMFMVSVWMWVVLLVDSGVGISSLVLLLMYLLLKS